MAFVCPCLCLQKVSLNIKMHREYTKHCKLYVSRLKIKHRQIANREQLHVLVLLIVSSFCVTILTEPGSRRRHPCLTGFKLPWIQKSQLLEETLELIWFPLGAGARWGMRKPGERVPHCKRALSLNSSPQLHCRTQCDKNLSSNFSREAVNLDLYANDSNF